MPTITIINSIKALSPAEQFFIIEQTLRFVREYEPKQQVQYQNSIENCYRELSMIAENYSATGFIGEWAGKFLGGEEVLGNNINLEETGNPAITGILPKGYVTLEDFENNVRSKLVLYCKENGIY